MSNKYDNMIKNKHQQKLNLKSKTVNKDINDKLKEEEYLNLSIKGIYNNLLQTIIDIINDLNSKKPLMETFTKGNRLFYLGILVIFGSFCMYLIDLTK